MKWKDKLINDITNGLNLNTQETSLFKSGLINNLANIHLAIFNEPFLNLLFTGQKTIESRFSINNVTPYRKIFKNDIVLVKKAGGPITGAFFVKNVHYYSNLNPKKISELEQLYGQAACWNIDPQYLEGKTTSKFLTIIEVGLVQKIKAIEVGKSDRTAWSIIRYGLANTLFTSKN